MRSKECTVSLEAVTKRYARYSNPIAHLISHLPMLRRLVKPVRNFTAIHSVNISIQAGECVGIVGRNGAGKSTLLQLIAGIMPPTDGSVCVRGRVAALLELGAGFNPKFTGRENIFLNGVLMGLSKTEIQEHLVSIISFSELGEKIDQPVSTYSSGMFMRLAFAVATAVMPDVLIIDEALSVGDGAFAKKSFDRIMAMKEQGVTIVFCSHATYHIDTICDRAIWIDHGAVQSDGPTADVLDEYNQFLVGLHREAAHQPSHSEQSLAGRILSATVQVDDTSIEESFTQLIEVKSGLSLLTVRVRAYVPPEFDTPNVAIVFNDAGGHNVSSCGTHVDGFAVEHRETGEFSIRCQFPTIPLLRGVYTIHIFLLCERGIHIYDTRQIATIRVRQEDSVLGLFRIPHSWVPS